jgi:ATP diphosphatase
MSHIDRLLEIMARLRDPVSGCPWDVQQDFSSIAPYTIEEAYEVVDAIARNNLPQLKDELGDLLLQVVFHAQMAEEGGHFGFGDVVGAICGKMIRRHPHVFGPDGEPADPGQRLADPQLQTTRWEAIKLAERGPDADISALAGIAGGLPEWVRAEKLQKRAATVGFDWPDVGPVLAKLHEEIDEVRQELQREPRDPQRLEEEIGDVLFVCVNLARHAGVDYGGALRRANLKFERRFRAMEAMAAAEGVHLRDLPLARQDAYWERAKRAEKDDGSRSA